MEQTDIESKTINGTDKIRIVSYNVENLYDTVDDPKTNDDDFTPSGEYAWDKKKYEDKLDNIAKAIISAGDDDVPALVAMCEIENKTVIEDLLNRKKMKTTNYKYVHKDSRDPRGIDVALLYNKDEVKLQDSRWQTVKLPNKSKTRDILYAKFVLRNKENLHVVVNHWPSMKEGEQASENKRIAAAQACKQVCDSIFKTDKVANIVLLGDFNTYPEKSSLTNTLGVKNELTGNIKENTLYNLMARHAGNRDMGTHKYQGEWNILDQIIVSGHMLRSGSKVYATSTSANICQSSFLLYQNKKGYYYPKRTFKGTEYDRGYSDHLPVTLDLYLEDK